MDERNMKKRSKDCRKSKFSVDEGKKKGVMKHA